MNLLLLLHLLSLRRIIRILLDLLSLQCLYVFLPSFFFWGGGGFDPSSSSSSSSSSYIHRISIFFPTLATGCWKSQEDLRRPITGQVAPPPNHFERGKQVKSQGKAEVIDLTTPPPRRSRMSTSSNSQKENFLKLQCTGGLLNLSCPCCRHRCWISQALPASECGMTTWPHKSSCWRITLHCDHSFTGREAGMRPYNRLFLCSALGLTSDEF